MADDIMATLRSLANRWAIRARDYASAAKAEGTTEAQASYNRGFAEGYYKAATELAAIIKDQATAPPPPPRSSAPRPAAPPQPRASAPTARPAAPPARPAASPQPAVPPAPTYAAISVGEALSVLEFAGTSARDIVQNKDNSFRAIFSRWENMMPHVRVEQVQKADNRIIILGTGKLDGNDPFIDFAFKEV
ncbi:MAG TPA: hypothetical protein VHD90_26345 [Phototrophicaceae bacterium]|nr:hypothetical protein [Phototrophicaceae bacterium]